MTKTHKDNKAGKLGAVGGRRSKNEGRARAIKQNFKLSDRAHFALRWLKAHSGARDMTMLMEELIEAAADQESKRAEGGRHWQLLFSDNEGIATLNLFALPKYTPTPPERPLHLFVRQHPTFFYQDEEQTQPSPQRVVILWPHVRDYVRLWNNTRVEDMWRAARVMAAELKKHGEPVPKGGGRW